MPSIGKSFANTLVLALLLLLCHPLAAQARIIQKINELEATGQTVTEEDIARIVGEVLATTPATETGDAVASQERQANVQTATEVTRASVQTVGSILSTRIETISQPLPAPGSSDSPGSPGTPGTPGAPAQEQDGGPGVPVPSKDNAALPASRGTMLAKAPAGQRGMSAGQDEAAGRRLGVWGMGAVSWTGNNQSGTNFTGNIYTALAGIDYRFLDALTLGAAIGYEGTNVSTWYNDGKTTGDGFTVMPYACLALTDRLIADAAFGMTFSQYHSSWFDSSSFVKRSRDYGAFRVLGSANLSYYVPVEAWLFKLTAGTILANENSSYLTGSTATSTGRQDNFFGELAAGGSVKYSIDKLAAKIGATYRYDYALKDGDQDRDEVQGLAGIEITPKEGVLLDVQATNSFFRDHVNNTTLSATLRLEY